MLALLVFADDYSLAFEGSGSANCWAEQFALVHLVAPTDGALPANSVTMLGVEPETQLQGLYLGLAEVKIDLLEAVWLVRDNFVALVFQYLAFAQLVVPFHLSLGQLAAQTGRSQGQ